MRRSTSYRDRSAQRACEDFAATVADAPILHVLFKVDDTLYALPADVVLQMESYTGATMVPGAPEFVAGIIQLRGRVVPVVDLRARFGLAPKERTLETRVVKDARSLPEPGSEKPWHHDSWPDSSLGTISAASSGRA